MKTSTRHQITMRCIVVADGTLGIVHKLLNCLSCRPIQSHGNFETGFGHDQLLESDMHTNQLDGLCHEAGKLLSVAARQNVQDAHADEAVDATTAKPATNVMRNGTGIAKEASHGESHADHAEKD